jgi:DNA repair photolyase
VSTTVNQIGLNTCIINVYETGNYSRKMDLTFQEYTVRKLVNVHKHVDGPWFWNKYSAHPYVGCRSGCEFCYLRGGQYLGRRDPETFDTVIQVKTNTLELLRRELAKLTPDVITAGDWQQPVEDQYKLSRAMLEVVYDLNFPLFVVERSPLLVRDLDLLTAISQRTWAGVVYSLSNVDPKLKQAFEPRSPGLAQRLKAMETLAKAGILVGASLMPIIPLVGDDETHLAEVIQAVRDHGGQFVLGGGLSMSGVQGERTLIAAGQVEADLPDRLRELYKPAVAGKPSYGPPRAYASTLSLRVRELCVRYGIADRMPRYVAPGPLAHNKRLAEKLFLKNYDLELEQAHETRVWAYRKAAWTVDEWPESVADLYTAQGERGLRTLPGIGSSIASDMASWLKTFA